jgi:hypothetical protein
VKKQRELWKTMDILMRMRMGTTMKEKNNGKISM